MKFTFSAVEWRLGSFRLMIMVKITNRFEVRVDILLVLCVFPAGENLKSGNI